MKKNSRFATHIENEETAVLLYISFVNYKHICTLYGAQCCAEIVESIQNHLFIFGFSFLSTSQDEMVISLNSCSTEVGLTVEALLLFFSTDIFFGRCLPAIPVLSISEVISSGQDLVDKTSIKTKANSASANLHSPQFTNEWRAIYEAEVNFCQRLVALLEEGECFLSLQPVYDMSGRELLYSEALLRFSGKGARVDIQRAITSFERTGQIRLIDRYVVNAVIDRLQQDSTSVIACNISAMSFNCDFWWESALRSLKKNPDIANRLIIELTEGAMVENHAAFLKFAKKIKSLGVRFALDDFGAGMPRAAIISVFTFDYIKLDKRLIKKMDCGSIRYKLVSNAIMCFQEMGVPVIAEGVENKDDVKISRLLGCNYMQGYYFGRPSSKNKILIKALNSNEYSAFGLSF